MGRLLQQLFQHNAKSYAALGSPVIQWLWWSWPTPQQDLPRFLSLTGLSQGRMQLSTHFSADELKAILRLGRWVLLNRPKLDVSPRCRACSCRSGSALWGSACCWLGLCR